MQDMMQMTTYFMIIIGVLALYSAITGKGPAYKNDYPKEMKEEANKMMRIACWIAAPIMIVTGILELQGLRWAYYVSLGTIVPGCIVFVILFRRKFKKYLK